ncbi:radical SAM/SPASM domain-containing protein [Enterococcus sp.]|uniref:radical SAM/SPASM domain-containing protein n=1 Tax=Enterococcus sp. TaxID=35783 RepID=UPI002FCB868C
MKHISVLIKPASGLCNIRCSYCFYANVTSLREVESYGRMTKDVAEKMIAQIFVDLVDGDQLTLAFQGGEPTIAGLPYFRRIKALVEEQTQLKAVTVHYAIQTNGMVINDAWCQFLKENNFLVGLSIDGHPMYHDMHRLDTKGKGTFHRVLKTKHLFDQYEIEYNVLCVLTNPLAKSAKKVYQFLQKENIQYIQFIPCLNDLGVEKRSSYALTPERFASFYRQMLRYWLEELEAGTYRSIKLFDDVFHLMTSRQVNACGLVGNCQVQYVIEADGSVYPCDFYVLDEYRLGYIQEQGLKELFEQDVSKAFLCDKPEISSYCQSCPFLQMCHGGCKRMRDSMYLSKQEDFCGYQAFLKDFLPQLQTIEQHIRAI